MVSGGLPEGARFYFDTAMELLVEGDVPETEKCLWAARAEYLREMMKWLGGLCSKGSSMRRTMVLGTLVIQQESYGMTCRTGITHTSGDEDGLGPC